MYFTIDCAVYVLHTMLKIRHGGHKQHIFFTRVKLQLHNRQQHPKKIARKLLIQYCLSVFLSSESVLFPPLAIFSLSIGHTPLGCCVGALLFSSKKFLKKNNLLVYLKDFSDGATSYMAQNTCNIASCDKGFKSEKFNIFYIFKKQQ